MKINFKFNKFILGLIFLFIALFIIYLVITCCKNNSILEGATGSSSGDNTSTSGKGTIGSVADAGSGTGTGSGVGVTAKLDSYNYSPMLNNTTVTSTSNNQEQNNLTSSSFAVSNSGNTTTSVSDSDNQYTDNQGAIFNIDNNSSTKTNNLPLNNNELNLLQGSGEPILNSSTSNIFTTEDGRQGIATPQNTIYGISRSSIPPGHEDLYILKSQVVPPVCPQCPSIEIDEALLKQKCQPCPPCARCPEPSFKCEKVPNYSLGGANQFLPMPILNDFSTFGA